MTPKATKPEDTPILDPVLQFMRLIWAVDHELQSVSKRMETTHGLTVPQRLSVLLIGRKPGILAGELAHLLHLHPGTVSGIVKRLEMSGLVQRTGDADDARRLRLMLTMRGRAVNRRRAGTFEDAARRVLETATQADVTAAARLLAQLARELQAVSRSHQVAYGRRVSKAPAVRRRVGRT